MSNFDFIYVGPQRTASSWLWEILRRHPQIYLNPHTKETYTFSAKGRNLDLRSAPDGRIYGEFCTEYFDDFFAMQRISTTIPNAKVIIGIRDPVEKAISLFSHHLSKGRVNDDFIKACLERPRILYSGFYSCWLPKWEHLFGRENVFYFQYNKLQEDGQQHIQELYDFLGVHSQCVSIDAEEKVGQATVAENKKLANIISKVANYLRDNNLHFLANFGKTLGIKKAYGKKGKIEVSITTLDKLRDIYKYEVQYLRNKGLY